MKTYNVYIQVIADGRGCGLGFMVQASSFTEARRTAKRLIADGFRVARVELS